MITFNNSLLINIGPTLAAEIHADTVHVDTSGFFVKCHDLFFPFKSENGFNFLIASAFAKTF